jgi:rhodanese-related sulfurtransferase
MPAKSLSSQEARDLLSSNDQVAYVDVRTVAEFSTGHPRGTVVNIPLVFHHPTTKEIHPNGSFLEVVASLYAKDKPLIIGGDNSERTQQAAEQLQNAGYTNLCIMPEGFSGWRTQKLPTTTDNRDGISYASLLIPVKRKGKKKKAAAHA